MVVSSSVMPTATKRIICDMINGHPIPSYRCSLDEFPHSFERKFFSASTAIGIETATPTSSLLRYLLLSSSSLFSCSIKRALRHSDVTFSNSCRRNCTSSRFLSTSSFQSSCSLWSACICLDCSSYSFLNLSLVCFGLCLQNFFLPQSDVFVAKENRDESG